MSATLTRKWFARIITFFPTVARPGRAGCASPFLETGARSRSDASSARAAAVPCAADAGGASAVSETNSFFSTSFARAAAGDGAEEAAGAESDAGVEALCRADWRGGAGVVDDGAAGDVVFEDGGGALMVTGAAGGAGEKETCGAAGAGALNTAACPDGRYTAIGTPYAPGCGITMGPR